MSEVKIKENETLESALRRFKRKRKSEAARKRKMKKR